MWGQLGLPQRLRWLLNDLNARSLVQKCGPFVPPAQEPSHPDQDHVICLLLFPNYPPHSCNLSTALPCPAERRCRAGKEGRGSGWRREKKPLITVRFLIGRGSNNWLLYLHIHHILQNYALYPGKLGTTFNTICKFNNYVKKLWYLWLSSQRN